MFQQKVSNFNFDGFINYYRLNASESRDNKIIIIQLLDTKLYLKRTILNRICLKGIEKLVC